MYLINILMLMMFVSRFHYLKIIDLLLKPTEAAIDIKSQSTVIILRSLSSSLGLSHTETQTPSLSASCPVTGLSGITAIISL